MKTFEVKGQLVLVDDAIYPLVVNLKWHLNTYGYVCQANKIYKVGKLGRTTITKFLHHVVLPPEEGLVTDHIDGNIYNNQLSNLRNVPQWVNMHNRSVQNNNTSGHKGISWNKIQQQWHAYLWIKRKRYHLGYFDKLEDAIKARKAAEQTILAPALV